MVATNYSRQSVFNKDFLIGFIFNVPIFLAGVSNISVALLIISLFFAIHKGVLKKKVLEVFMFITGLTIFSFVVTYFNNLNYAGTYKIGIFYVTLSYCLFFIASISKIEMFLKGFLLCTMAFFIFLCFNFDVIKSDDRLNTDNMNPIWIGRLAGFAIIITAFLKNLRFKYLYVLLCTIIIVLAGSKGPILALLFVLFVSNLISTKLKSLLLLFILVVSVYLYYTFDFIKLFFDHRLLTFNPNSEYLFDRIEGDRLDIYLVSIPNFFNNFFNNFLSTFFGFGVNNAVYLYKSSFLSYRWYPHNIMLEILFEYGILGFSLFVYLFVKALKIIKSKIVFYGIIFFFICAQFSGDNPLNWMLFFFMIYAFYNNKIEIIK